ncbi:hypothetical protein D3C86_1403270 [compost metagenome]
MQRGNKVWARVGVVTILRARSLCVRRLPARRRTSCRFSKTLPVAVSSRRASAVGYSCPRTRVNSSKPSCASAWRRALVAAGWEMLSRLAAPVTEPVCRIA